MLTKTVRRIHTRDALAIIYIGMTHAETREVLSTAQMDAQIIHVRTKIAPTILTRDALAVIYTGMIHAEPSKIHNTAQMDVLIIHA